MWRRRFLRAGTADEFVNDLPIGGGFRVPCIIVSPWTTGGWVCSENFDHTSVLQFLEHFTGVRETNISDWRRKTFGDLTSVFNFRKANNRAAAVAGYERAGNAGEIYLCESSCPGLSGQRSAASGAGEG